MRLVVDKAHKVRICVWILICLAVVFWAGEVETGAAVLVAVATTDWSKTPHTLACCSVAAVASML